MYKKNKQNKRIFKKSFYFLLILSVIFLPLFVNTFVREYRFYRFDKIPFMELYKGKTVTISGEVIFKDYKAGPILVMAHNKYRKDLPPLVTVKEIDKPGKYSIKIANNIGNLFIDAANLGENWRASDIPSVSYGCYENSPLLVGSSDIDNINIYLKEIHRPIMETYKGPTITISGEIAFKDYKKGNIFIFVSPYKAENKFSKISIKKISSPGRYEIAIPENIGEVDIEAINAAEGIVEPFQLSYSKPNSFISAGLYSGNPLKVGSSDISHVNITLYPAGRGPIMDSYEGPTVEISGEVKYKEYSLGKILILARTHSNPEKPPDIAVLELLSPGKFKLKVPKNIGALYIDAVNVKEEWRRGSAAGGTISPSGSYPKNPLKVGSSDISHVNITLYPAGRGPIMDSYEGPTVEISGEVKYKEYSLGKILILARTHSNPEKPPDIAVLELLSPGKFKLKVPKNIGALYIDAVNVKEEWRRGSAAGGTISPSGSYPKNPLKVGSNDIAGIKIALKKSTR